jgi:ferredoxin
VEIAEIYAKFDRIGCLTFATIDRDTPQTRIAHLFAHDHEGLYFRTMVTKPFCEQLRKTSKVSICGMFPGTAVGRKEDGMPYFPPGYTIRATGDVKELTLESLKEKAAVNRMFMVGVTDIAKYTAMTAFCLYRAWGEVFDFDFEMEHRSHKILRTGFCFGGRRIPFRGVRITEACVACGECLERCSFKAIYQSEGRFLIDHARCDVCGDCFMICPTRAVEIVIGEPSD